MKFLLSMMSYPVKLRGSMSAQTALERSSEMAIEHYATNMSINKNRFVRLVEGDLQDNMTLAQWAEVCGPVGPVVLVTTQDDGGGGLMYKIDDLKKQKEDLVKKNAELKAEKESLLTRFKATDDVLMGEILQVSKSEKQAREEAKDRVNAMKQSYKTELQAKQQSHETELQAKQQAYDTELQARQQAYDTELKKQQQKCESDVKAAYDSAIQEQQRKHESEMEAMTLKLESEIEAMRRENESALEAENTELKTIESKYESERIRASTCEENLAKVFARLSGMEQQMNDQIGIMHRMLGDERTARMLEVEDERTARMLEVGDERTARMLEVGGLRREVLELQQQVGEQQIIIQAQQGKITSLNVALNALG